MNRRYYIDLDVLSRRFDRDETSKIKRERRISAEIHNLLENGHLDCICSQTLKDETRLIPKPFHRGWLFDLYKKPGFCDCVWVSSKIENLSQELMEKCGFEKKDLNDATHITIAAVEKVDIFWTYNTKHFIEFGRKKCIEDFFLKELKHKITISTPPNLSTLQQLGQSD